MFYVRLQNLPFGACQVHIREFFHGLTVPSGGVSIHRGCAFVVFNSQHDAQLAVSMDKRFLNGKEVRVSNADPNDVQRTQMYDVRRKLMVSVPECWTMMKYRKRIRPTSVKDGTGEIASKKFRPDEIEFPGKVDEFSVKDVKFPGKVDMSCLNDGKLYVKVDELCMEDKFPVNVNDSFSQKIKEPVRRTAMKKTIKPTPVNNLNQFKLVYEGTVF